ncbi:hypothetical protein M8J76_009027 [Diaphorina citri]|nr:hypothetical protein M8J75_014613 [Diaphorina citri]KAI5736980.1 hypothetical protein M8J76_009027 [Diaphorina citri]
MDDFLDYIGTQQLSHNTTETSVTLQKTLYLLINNEKKLLKLGENTIGRSEDSDICLKADTISYHHAIIECEVDDFYIKDLKSTNLTKRDGKIMKPYVVYELKSGSHIVFGDIEATFYAIDDELNQSTDQEEVSVPEIEEDVTDDNVINQSLSLLDTSVGAAQVAEAIEIKAGTPPVPPLVSCVTGSVSKWDQLKLPALDFTEDDNLNDRSESSTDSEFEFFNRNSASSPSKDLSNVNCKTRVLNNSNDCTRNTSTSMQDAVEDKLSSIHDLETQKSSPPRKHNNIYDLETQRSPPQHIIEKQQNIYDLETQQSSVQISKKKQDIHEHETQMSPPQRSKKKQDIHELETQMSPPQRSKKKQDIHELETQMSPPQRSKKKQDIHELETQMSPPQRLKKKQDIHELETQMSPPQRSKKKQDIHELETQMSPPQRLKKKQDIHELETQMSPPQRSKKKQDIHELETQMSPPQRSKKKQDIHEFETQMSPPQRSKKKQDIHELETQMSPPQRSRNKQNHPSKLWDSEMYNQDTQYTNNINQEHVEPELYKNNKMGAGTENENKSKTKKKIVKKTEDDDFQSTSDEENYSRNTRSKRKKRTAQSRKANVKETESPSEGSSTDIENMKNNGKIDKKSHELEESKGGLLVSESDNTFADLNGVPADSTNITNVNDTNSESFIGMVVGNKKRFIVSSSSEDSHSDTENQTKQHESLNKPSSSKQISTPSHRDKRKAELNSTYDVTVQNSIDDLYKSELECATSQIVEESQFINEVSTQHDKQEPPESQFTISEDEQIIDEEDPTGSPNLLPQESQSLLDHNTEASSKNTTNYDISEMELDSFLDEPKPKGSKIVQNKPNNTSVSLENNSSMFSVSETEIRPEFVQDEDINNEVNHHTKAKKIVPVNEDSSTTSDFELFDKKRKTEDKKSSDVSNQIEEETEASSRSTDPKPLKNKPTEKKKAKPGKATKKIKKLTGQRISSDHGSDSTDSDFEFTVTAKNKHGTVEINDATNQNVNSINASRASVENQKPINKDFFEIATQKVSMVISETDESFVAPTQENTPSNEDFFEAATQKASVGASDTDNSFVAPTQKNTPLESKFFEAATQKVIETDESFVASTRQNTPSNDDFFEAATQKTSVGPSDTDNLFVAPTQKNTPLEGKFFKAATSKVIETDESFVVSTRQNTPSNEDFFEAATQKVSAIPNEADEQFATKNKALNEDFFEAATQKASSVPSSDSDESCVSPTQKKNPIDVDFFQAATQKVSVGSTSADEYFVAPTQNNACLAADFFEVATQKVSFGRMDSCSNAINQENNSSDEDFFNAITRKVVLRKKEDTRNDNVVPIDLPTEPTAKKSNNFRTLRSRRKEDSESSNFSVETKEIGKKKLNTRKGKREVEPKKETNETHENDGKKKETRGRKRQEKVTSDEKREDSEHKVSERTKRTVKSKKNDTKDKSSEEISLENSDLTNPKSSSSLKDEVSNIPVKRELTRERKRNPRYEEPESKSNIKKETKEQKELHKKSTTEHSEKTEKGNIDESIAQNSNENIIQSEENPSKGIQGKQSKPLRSTRGCKKTTKNESKSAVDTLEKSETSFKNNRSTKTTPGKELHTAEPGDQYHPEPEVLRTPSRRKQNELAILHGLTSPQVILDNTEVILKPKTKASSASVKNTKCPVQESSRGSKENSDQSKVETKEDTIASRSHDEAESSTVRGKPTVKREKKSTGEDVKKESPAKKRAKKTEDKGQSDELQTSVVTTSRGSTRGRPCKGSTEKPESATKRKDLLTEETMKAPSTPKRMKRGKELPNVSVRASPRQRGPPCHSVRSSLIRQRSSSSSSESVASDSTSASERRLKLSISSAKSAEIKVTFTMIDNTAKYVTLLSSLHASITDNPITSDILVTKKVVRSLKFLLFLAQGKPIVSLKWLTDSERCMKFAPHEKYILHDEEAERTYGFSLSRSIAAAKENNLLDSYQVYVTGSVKPAPADMKSIVECSGGTFLSKVPSSWAPYSIIVTDPSDSTQLKKLLSVPGTKPSVVNKEFILSGILQQKLDFVKHKFQL